MGTLSRSDAKPTEDRYARRCVQPNPSLDRTGDAAVEARDNLDAGS